VVYPSLILLEILPEVNKVRPALVTKNLSQFALKLLDDTKAETKGAATKLIKALYKELGESFLGTIPAGKLGKVREIITI